MYRVENDILIEQMEGFKMYNERERPFKVKNH